MNGLSQQYLWSQQEVETDCLNHEHECLNPPVPCIIIFIVWPLSNYTGQQRKYTGSLSEISQILLIWGRWFRIRHYFLSITSKFSRIARLAVFGSTFSISKFRFLFDFSENKIKSAVISEKMTEIGQAVSDILSFKVKKSSKLCDFFQFFYFPHKSSFRLWRTNDHDLKGVAFFILKQNTTLVFFHNGLFCSVTRFCKILQYSKKG